MSNFPEFSLYYAEDGKVFTQDLGGEFIEDVTHLSDIERQNRLLEYTK